MWITLYITLIGLYGVILYICILKLTYKQVINYEIIKNSIKFEFSD
jgi:hypothetical protein